MPGQLLAIAQNTAVFSLLRTNFGGDSAATELGAILFT
jgi:microcystin-dependent protein